MSYFEVMMLLCFGFAWPVSIYKGLKTKNFQGKSPMFLYIIMVGYLMGILNKIFYNYDVVIYLYGLNFLMVLADLLIYYRNKKLYLSTFAEVD